MEMAKIIQKDAFGKPVGHIPVDQWDTESHPIDEKDRIFRNIHGEIILPIAEFFCENDEEKKSLDYFVMSVKRSYNSDETRAHICRYLNYFEKFYDHDKELLMYMYKIKITIDFMQSYSKEAFLDDVNRYIIQNYSLTRKIWMFVNDNYLMSLSSNNNKTPNLQFENKHAKILYEISLLMNIYIPLAAHFMYINGIRQSVDIQRFMLELFDLCNTKFKRERNVDIYNKIYETALSVVNKSKNPDKPLWEKNLIRGRNTTIHAKDSVNDVILQIMPKYSFDRNVINFNYYSNRQALKYGLTDIAYEFAFSKLSSSKRASDQNSEYDRYEARLNKRNEALAMQNKVAANQTVDKIEALYGPFSQAEIDHYKKKLTRDGDPVINALQKQLVSYLYDKEFGDPVTINSIRNQTDYIKLLIASKRILKKAGMTILPYVISSKVIRTASRKVVNKRDQLRIEKSTLYEQIQQKYKNPKIEQKIWEFIGVVISSQFEIIDWDEENGCPSQYDGIKVPMIVDLLTEELLFFISII